MNVELLKSIRTSIKEGNLRAFVDLIEANPDAIKMDTAFGSWLHVAASKGQLEMVKELVKRGMDINARGGIAGGNALHSAVANNHAEVAKYLLNAGAEMDVSEPERNPLFGAVMEENVGMGKLLIERGIDWKARYTGSRMKDMDALAFAKERGAREFVEYLESLR
jgi:ankyrin repeat protein